MDTKEVIELRVQNARLKLQLLETQAQLIQAQHSAVRVELEKAESALKELHSAEV